MTRQEFETWIEQHYDDLLRVARRRTQCEPEDVLQSAVAGMLDSSVLPDVLAPSSLCLCGFLHQMAPWPWAVAFVRYAAAHARVSAQRKQAVVGEVKNFSRAATFHGRGRRMNADPGRLWEDAR